MIGDVGGEIGPRTIGFLERSVDVVAKLGGAKQGLRPRLPIIRGLALGRLEYPGIDQSTLVERCDTLVDCSRFDQLALRSEAIVVHAEQCEVFTDQRHHLLDREIAQRPKPFAFRHAEPSIAVTLDQRPRRIDQVFTRIEPLGDRTDLFAQRLAIAQVERAGEDVDLRAGVVGVIFAMNREPGFRQQ